jgi:tRNA1(Val) A37 N6-methylase TrmN6
MEVVNDLLNYRNLKIIQRKDGFNFSLDSVMLANFVTINKKAKHICDLGTGNAPIPLIMSTRTDASIVGVEIQEISKDLAERSIKMNKLEDQISIVHDDLKGVHLHLGSDKFDVVTCNPPFFKVGETPHLNESEYKMIARHEIHATLEDVIRAAKALLKNNGYFAMVHRPERLLEILEFMKLHNIEPKRVQFVYPKKDKDANILLIEGRKNGNSGLKILPPLYSHKSNGDYTDEVMAMFGGE